MFLGIGNGSYKLAGLQLCCLKEPSNVNLSDKQSKNYGIKIKSHLHLLNKSATGDGEGEWKNEASLCVFPAEDLEVIENINIFISSEYG